MRIEFKKTEIEFLKMLLNEVITSPFLRNNLLGEGQGFKPYAFNLLRKLNGKPIYKTELRDKYNKYIRKIVRSDIQKMLKAHKKTKSANANTG